MQLVLVAASSFVVDLLEHWATEAGLTVVDKSGILVRVEGEMAAMEKALRVQFSRIESGWHTTDQPTLPHGAQAVVGLSTKGRLESHAVVIDNPAPTLASPGNDGLTPAQVNIAYGVDQAHYDGSGQVLAIAEWGGGFVQSDIDDFCQAMNLPACTPEWVGVGSLSGNDPASPSRVETTLDICWAHAMAPGATIKVYNASAGGGGGWAPLVVDVLHAVLTDPVKPAVLSISYGAAEEDFHAQDLVGWNALIDRLNTRGIPVLVSSGDSGAYGKHTLIQAQVQRVSGPASCPAAVAVGGTALYLNGMAYETEWGWSNDINSGAGGGGYSTVFQRPSYQDHAVTNAQRGVPDIAACASTTTYAYLRVAGQLLMIGGTSWAAPVVAGLLTRVASGRAVKGLTPLTDIHPDLYQHTGLSRDITVGNNNCYAVTGFSCRSGWDEVTGMGSPKYAAWEAYWVEGTTPATQPTSSQSPLTVSALASAPDGHYGSSMTPLQTDAREVAFVGKNCAGDGGALFVLAHRPLAFWTTAMTAADHLWQAGVRN